jgi:glycosyltransferase involved in cell wall biosynthesis
MHIAIVNRGTIPAGAYGGTERVIWWLGKALVRAGHRVTYLVEGGACPFAAVLRFDPSQSLSRQAPPDADIVHAHFAPDEPLEKPHVVTVHGNTNRTDRTYPVNTVFVSRNHAERHGSGCYVRNGLDPHDYGMPDMNAPRTYAHFLGDAAWRVKNLRGAIRVARLAGRNLRVLGGHRLNFRRGFRLTLSPRVRFHGFVGGEEKNRVIGASAGLVFPVRWHEPFGLAVIESLYFGCPVFATPYGSLPELVSPEVGVLSTDSRILAERLRDAGSFDRRRCREHVMEYFRADRMAAEYMKLYERVLAGETLNPTPPRLQAIGPQFLPFA